MILISLIQTYKDQVNDGGSIMTMHKMKTLLVIIGVIFAACLIVGLLFELLQLIIVGSLVAVIALILYAIFAPKLLKKNN